MGWADWLINIGGDVAGSFIGDPMLGQQIEGVKGAIGGGGKGGGPAGISKTSPTFRRAEQLGDLSKNYAFDYALPEGKKLLGEAESTLQKPADYYSQLLSGNRAEMMGAVAPEVGAISDQYQQNKQNISKFTPQGGGQTSLLSELPFRQSRDVTTLLEKVRPEAAKGLERVSAAQGALSGQVTGEGLQSGALSLNAISDQINALLGKAGLEIPLQQQTGAGAYQILNQLINKQGGGDVGADPSGYEAGFPGDPNYTGGATPIDAGGNVTNVGW